MAASSAKIAKKNNSAIFHVCGDLDFGLILLKSKKYSITLSKEIKKTNERKANNIILIKKADG